MAFGPAYIRRMTAVTAAVTHACLFTKMLCYVLEELHPSYVFSTKVGLHRIKIWWMINANSADGRLLIEATFKNFKAKAEIEKKLIRFWEQLKTQNKIFLDLLTFSKVQSHIAIFFTFLWWFYDSICIIIIIETRLQLMNC